MSTLANIKVTWPRVWIVLRWVGGALIGVFLGWRGTSRVAMLSDVADAISSLKPTIDETQSKLLTEEGINDSQSDEVFDLYVRLITMRAEMIADARSIKQPAEVRARWRGDAVNFYLREFDTQRRAQLTDLEDRRKRGLTDVIVRDLGKVTDLALRARWIPPSD